MTQKRYVIVVESGTNSLYLPLWERSVTVCVSLRICKYAKKFVTWNCLNVLPRYCILETPTAVCL